MINQLTELFKLVGVGLVLMLPLANSLTSMTLLLSLGHQIPYKERERQITMAAFYVVAIMLVTYYGGNFIMQTFGISIPGLRIAGGLIVAVIGFTMLFPANALQEIPEAELALSDAGHQKVPNIAFVPLALPGPAGPGTIAMIVSATSVDAGAISYTPWVLAVSPFIVFAILGFIFWLCLRSAGRIVSLIGDGGVQAISRVMGFLLVCMAVQFVINGILEIIAQNRL